MPKMKQSKPNPNVYHMNVKVSLHNGGPTFANHKQTSQTHPYPISHHLGKYWRQVGAEDWSIGQNIVAINLFLETLMDFPDARYAVGKNQLLHDCCAESVWAVINKQKSEVNKSNWKSRRGGGSFHRWFAGGKYVCLACDPHGKDGSMLTKTFTRHELIVKAVTQEKMGGWIAIGTPNCPVVLGTMQGNFQFPAWLKEAP